MIFRMSKKNNKIDQYDAITQLNKFIKYSNYSIESAAQVIYFLNLTNEERLDCARAIAVIQNKHDAIQGKKLKDVRRHVKLKRLIKCMRKRRDGGFTP